MINTRFQATDIYGTVKKITVMDTWREEKSCWTARSFPDFQRTVIDIIHWPVYHQYSDKYERTFCQAH